MVKNNIRELTPKSMACGGDSDCCPAIFESEGTYLMIGKKVDADKFELRNRIGEDEVLIEVEKRLIDERSE